ncbi:hypothetical protein WA026_010065 [Henosepilachna vigintioctopunctata]|uniref:Ionotropic receptor n=1 Tax=Henosepilachna vigintioctopunctata TaxID=420089 RepID=A0AAW1UHK1_9CUCU
MRLTSAKLVNASLTITQCLNIILQKHASPKDVILLNTDRTVMNFKVMRIDVRRGRIFNDIPTDLPDFYVIEISSQVDMMAFVEEIILHHEMLVNLRGKFLFIGENFSFGYYQIILINNLINSIFFDSGSRFIYKLNLYHNGIFRIKGAKLALVGKCGAEFEEYENLFEVKFPRKGEKHEITVGYYGELNKVYQEYVNFSRPGLEIEIIDAILEHLNINHNFIPMKPPEIFHFGLFADILICGCHFENHATMDQTASYQLYTVKWLVPVPEKIERWRYILLVFSPVCWILFISGLLSILTAFFLTKYTDLYSDKISIVHIFYVIFLGRTKRFRKKYISLDIFVFCTVFWSVMLNYLFCSKLTYLLNGISYEKGIETFEDIVKEQFTIVFADDIDIQTMKALPELRNYPDYLFEIWPKYAKSWDALPDHNHRVHLMPAHLFRLQKWYINNRTGLNYLKELDPPFLTFFIGAYFHKAHPFFDYFNRHVQYFIESGLSRRIIEHYEAPKWEQPTLEPTQKLEMEHIQAPLMILAVGLMLSLLVFFFELSNWNYTKRSTC